MKCTFGFFVLKDTRKDYRYAVQPTSEAGPAGTPGKKKKRNRKEELENLKREVEMVSNG